MKHLHWIGAAFLVSGAGLMGCDGAGAPEAEQAATGVPAEAAAVAASNSAVPANGASVAATVQPGAADLKNSALADVAMVDQPVKNGVEACSLTGNAGDTVECAIKLGRDSDGVAARALQGTLVFDGNRAALSGFVAEMCTAAGDCARAPIGENGLKSGHILKSTPVGDAAKNGRATFMVMNLTAPQTAISEALAGEAGEVFSAAFTLTEDVRNDNPFKVTIGNVIVADAEASAVQARVEGGTIITGKVASR